ncbi:glycosyltransferase family 2 protein [Aestuariivivens sediminis]|uniref:glycosyltransferase family 2 protein n=1 Tax=Aestuariivivens sediminis TaxID=2913557 RepID=UPI001F565815|nr:glycosyltransferase family 2 protein [Aestuariivivens sediminis]
MPFFSIVIPLFNKVDYIYDTLTSVLNQSFQDFEVIIVNDASTDGSIDIVKSFKDPRIKIYEQENQGASVARNYGIEQAESDFIALIDADDIWYQDHLEELIKLINTFPESGLFCNNYEIKRSDQVITPAKFNFKYYGDCLIIEDYFKSSIINSVAWTSSSCFKKEIFNEIGRFDINLRTGQDIDLWIRIALKFEVAFNPKTTVLYHNFDRLSLSNSKYNNQRYYLISKFTEEEKSNPSLKTYLDINRYALAIRCILNDEKILYGKLKKEINYNNLNFKQQILLRLPKNVLRLTKKIQDYFIQNNIYLSAYG